MKKTYEKPVVVVIDLTKDMAIFTACNNFVNDANSCYVENGQ